jgi:hypothetical protein
VLDHYSKEKVVAIDATQPPAKVLLEILHSMNGAYEPAAI